MIPMKTMKVSSLLLRRINSSAKKRRILHYVRILRNLVIDAAPEMSLFLIVKVSPAFGEAAGAERLKN